MKHLITSFHPSITSIEGQRIINRKATRAIVLDGEDILLLFTERYHDYSLPGGGPMKVKIWLKVYVEN